MMRDVKRMQPFMEEIIKEWEKLPDWRFGQLMYNFIYTVGDPFYWEEEKFLEELKKFVDSVVK